MELFAFGVFFVAVMLLHVTTVNALKCYECSSTKDWANCNDIKKEKTCPSSATRCIKVEGHVKGGEAEVDGYAKGCVPASDCDKKNIPLCNSKVPGVSVDCTVNCCDGDLCNTGTVPLVSGLVLMTCALLSMLNMF